MLSGIHITVRTVSPYVRASIVRGKKTHYKEDDMNIDWNKVTEASILIVPTALAGAYFGARVKVHIDRAKPNISVTGFRVGTGADLIVSRVKIPANLTTMLRANPWAPRLYGEVNAGKLPTLIDKLERSLIDAQTAIAFLQGKISELSVVAQGSANEKIAFLNDITEPEYKIIDAAYTGALVRQEIRLSLPPDEELHAKNPHVAEYVERAEDTGGYSINLQRAWYNLLYRDKRDNPSLLPAVKAIVHFHEPSLRQILDHSLHSITNWAATGVQIVTTMKSLIAQTQPLIVEVRITNSGRSSALFTPWAVLEIISPNMATPDIRVELVRSATYWKPDDPIKAAQQEAILQELPDIRIEKDSYFVVEAGKSVKMVYRSEKPVNTLKDMHTNLLDIMAMDLFRCQIHLKRADIDRSARTWIHSSMANFGTKAEQFPADEITVAIAPDVFGRKWWSYKLRKWIST